VTWVASAIGAASTTMGALQYFGGKRKSREAGRLAEQRPQFEVPEEIIQNVQLAKQQAMVGMPEEQRRAAMRDISRSQAFTAGQLGTRKAGLTGLGALNQQTQDASLNLAAQDAAMRQANQGRVFEQQDLLGQYRAQEFEINRLQPHLQQLQALRGESQGLLGAGLQNIGAGIQTAGLADWAGRRGGLGGAPGAGGMQPINTGGAQPANVPQPPMIAANQMVTNPTVGYNPPGMTSPAFGGGTAQNAYTNPFYAPQTFR